MEQVGALFDTRLVSIYCSMYQLKTMNVSMNSAYMCYYEHLAKLARVSNNKTLFLAYVFYCMEWDADSKQVVLNIDAHTKRRIMDIVSPSCNNKIKMANRYLSMFVKAEIIKPIGGGAYLVDPLSYGGHKYIPKALRASGSAVYEARVFRDAECKVTESYIITDNGERVDL